MKRHCNHGIACSKLQLYGFRDVLFSTNINLTDRRRRNLNVTRLTVHLAWLKTSPWTSHRVCAVSFCCEIHVPQNPNILLHLVYRSIDIGSSMRPFHALLNRASAAPSSAR